MSKPFINKLENNILMNLFNLSHYACQKILVTGQIPNTLLIKLKK